VTSGQGHWAPAHHRQRIVDSDGEFLLIEAAEHVPDSYDPETAERRVYISGGLVHLLPPDQHLTTSLPDDDTITTMAAVQAVRDGGDATRAAPQLQQAVQNKIDGYPGKITESHHRALVRTPAAAAALLEACPQLLPAAVQAFYLRDPIDLKACRSMRFFPPETCVRTVVTMTRTLYAQLASQQYRPDVRTGWQIPAGGDEAHKAADLGCKLACGLEILACRGRPSSAGDDVTGLDPSLEQLRGDVRWQRYLVSLKDKHYFGEELEGSQLYTTQLERARQYYVRHLLSEPRTSTSGEAVLKLLGSVRVDHNQWRRREAELPLADDDSWLQLGPDQLEQLLEQQFQQQQQQQPGQLAGELQQFLASVSGLEGVEPPAKAARSRKTSRKTSTGNPRKPSTGAPRKTSAAARKISTLSQASTSSAMSSLSQKIDFNADSFTDAMRGMLDLGLDEDKWDEEDDSSGMSSYGDESADELDELVDERGQMRQLMAAMDEELGDSTLADSFVRATHAVRKESGASDSSGAGLDEVESFKPVDVDLNTVQNLLQSLQGQTGAGGPAQTLLQSMAKQQQQQ